MKIIPFIFNNQLNQAKQNYTYHTKAMPFDSVCFGAMKKSQFEGIDLMMINQLKAPIQKFKSNKDFQAYCKEILDSEYLGEQNIKKISHSLDPQAESQKDCILKDWINYITVENKTYTPAIQLMILSSITKNLKHDTNHLPPILDKKELASTIEEIDKKSKTQKNYSCNFDKLYRTRLLETTFQSETQLDENLNGWVVIPSKETDPQNFDENLKKLQILSCDTWCTKTYNAKPYLASGDFHIYFENGKAKLGLRMCDGMLSEIQGEKNNDEVPFLYFNELNEYIKKKNFKVTRELLDKMEIAQEQKEFCDLIGEDAIKNKDLRKILPHFGFKFQIDKNGMLILDNFVSEDKFTYKPLKLKELGITYEDIFDKTSKVKNNFYARNDEETDTRNIEEVGGGFYTGFSKIKTMGKIRKIGKNFNAQYAFDLKSLGELKYIGGNVQLPYFKDFKDKILNLDYIGGYLKFEDKSFAQPILLLKGTPLSRPITYEEYQNWKIDEENLTLDEIQAKINGKDFTSALDNIFNSAV